MAAPVITIIGPTASGKTALAIRTALAVGGEIICADSRTVYRGLDIGTAKPSEDERAAVPHHLLDIVEPNQVFTAADFQRLATAAIADVRARGKVPFVVGGTGLYVDGLLYGYKFGAAADPALRARLQAMSLEELHAYCKKYNIALPENTRNKRYVIRAIEQNGVNHQRERTKKFNGIIVGLRSESQALRRKITQRAEIIFSSGVVEETAEVATRYGWGSEAMSGNIYPIIRDYLEGRVNLSEAKAAFITADTRLAKRQLTWFKRNPDIEWFDEGEAAYRRIVQYTGSSVSS